jgi:hypothetical protein
LTVLKISEKPKKLQTFDDYYAKKTSLQQNIPIISYFSKHSYYFLFLCRLKFFLTVLACLYLIKNWFRPAKSSYSTSHKKKKYSSKKKKMFSPQENVASNFVFETSNLRIQFRRITFNGFLPNTYKNEHFCFLIFLALY